MHIIQSLTNTDNVPIALTIGNFDGVHIGHQEILNKLVKLAKKHDYHPSAMTFLPHAKVYFGKTKDFLILSDKDKAKYISENGIKTLYQIPFNKDFSNICALEFIETIISKLNIKYLLVGDDFRFGNKGEGDYNLMCDICKKYDISIENTSTIKVNNYRVSSSIVRDAIKKADFNLVKKMLNRPILFCGKVISGKKLGRTIGFPTANFKIDDSRILPNGSFVVTVKVKGHNKIYGGMCNIGIKPTLGLDNSRLIEVHILDFDEDLYGKHISIEPIIKIRDEIKFKEISDLTKQLHKDKDFSIKYLNKTNFVK